MKIALITLGYKPYRTSGFDLAGERLVDALLRAGHEVTLIAAKKGDIVETVVDPALKIYRIDLDQTDWFGFASRVARLLEKIESVDVVHFYDISFSFAYRGDYVASLQHSYNQRLNSMGRLQLKECLYWLFYFLYYTFAKQVAEKPALTRARGLLATSSTTLNEYKQNYHVPAQKMALARHSIDTSFFCKTNVEELKHFRTLLNIGFKDPVILFAGFITPRKGIEYLARAMPKIVPAPTLIIVGKWRNEAYREKVQALLETVQNRVIELGFVPEEQLPVLYSLADVYVSTSLMEGFGLPLGEALACETPVVAFDAGAVAEVVGPGGILAPARDIDALAGAISSLLQRPGARQVMGAEGRRHILREFSVDSMLRSTLDAYQRFLGVTTPIDV